MLILALITMWDSSAQQRAARYATTEETAGAEDEAVEGAERAGVPASATGFPVPPIDLPHYHGVGIGNETSSKEVTGA